jgi:hypothetical protein
MCKLLKKELLNINCHHLDSEILHTADIVFSISITKSSFYLNTLWETPHFQGGGWYCKFLSKSDAVAH